MKLDDLILRAREASEKAYAPYSHFRVGAALLTGSGQVFVGCNVENVSYGLTICAERSAVSAAVVSGVLDFTKIVIFSDSKTPVSPCGACRQVLAEFSPNMEFVSVNASGEQFLCSLDALLPRAKIGILGS
jgi:cytidine deaminase